MKTDLPAHDEGFGEVPLSENAAALAAEDAPATSIVIGGRLLKIPAILLEGDDPESDTAAEDAHKFSVESGAPIETGGELPESYGTQKLLLAARDPNWLYAHWDLTREQQRAHCEQALDEELFLRVHREIIAEQPVAEVRVNPGARHWFVHVGQPGANYLAELGYNNLAGKWTVISTSNPVATPPAAAFDLAAANFATVPFDVPLEKLPANLGTVATSSVSTLTTGREALLTEAAGHAAPRAMAASLDLAQQIAQLPPTEIFPPTSPGGMSSPFGGGQAEKNFWFNLNAELIIYGATESDATVTIGGRPITLRPDGSFSFRFALPEGIYELPVVAVSADRSDGRAAELKFTRATEFRGKVGIHPQDRQLKPPAPENL